MNLGTLKEVLDRPGGRTMLGLMLGVRHWMTYGIWVTARWRRGDNEWQFSYPDADVRSTAPILNYYAYKESIARDAYLRRYVPSPGDIVVHVGAGSGWEARLFSRLVGPQGKV